MAERATDYRSKEDAGRNMKGRSRSRGKMSTTGLYAIDYFTTERGLGMSQYGPSIVLAGDTVKALLQTKMDVSLIRNAMLERIEKSFKGRHCHMGQAIFHEDTLMLKSLSVGGNCACLGIDGNALSDMREGQAVRYHPHNIDSAEQSSVALSAWLLWFNAAICFTSIEQPYAI